MLETREPIQVDDQTVARGYHKCRVAVKKYLKPHLWLVANVAGQNRQGIDAVLAHLLTTMELMDLESTNGLSLDVWQEVRDDVGNAFRDQYARIELAALVDTCRRFEVPRQFIFDPLRGVDLWIRSRRFANFDELETFCSYVGGATMAALVPVIGKVRDDYELPAIECGKAVMLTQILANCVDDLKHNRMFLAEDDLQEYNVDISRMKLRQPQPAMRHFVRLYVSRLTEMYHRAGHLVSFLDFDGKRSLKALLAWNWKLLTRLQQDPERVLQEDGVLTSSETLALKSKHLLGIDPRLSIFPAEDPHH